MPSEFKTRLVTLRLSKGISQVYTAKHIGVARQTYLDIESGKREPRLSTVAKLAAMLNCSPEWLAFGVGVKDTTALQQAIKSLSQLL